MADTELQQPAKPLRTETSLHRLWRGLLLFLEIIGLRREEQNVSQAEQLARLRLYHTEFRKLIAANHSFLETLGDLEEKRSGHHYLDSSLVKRKAARALMDVHAMVESINVISGDRYPSLRQAFERIADTLTKSMEDQPEQRASELVLELPAISGMNVNVVGGKIAHLAEIANTLGLPTPDGLAVTTEGFRVLLEGGGIRSWIQDKHLEIVSEVDVGPVSWELQERILGLQIPPAMEQAILGAYDRMAERAGKRISVAVRSSAVGEDSEFSFAGQFLSVLNVPREELCAAYLRVIASLFSPEAMHYRFLHKIPGESAEMAVGFIAMVDAVASGVVFSRDPGRPDSDKVLIQAVKGLGVTLVDGRTSPENLLVSRDFKLPTVTRTPSSQESRMVLAPGSGMKEEKLEPGEAEQPCLTDDEALQLARWAILLENHFVDPQDIEWAMGMDRRILLVQSRPLRLAARSIRNAQPRSGITMILEGGETGCPGVGSGPAILVSDDSEIDSFPQGGVLVARRSSPKFIRLMSKTKAIVTDVGSTTGHMASLAREFRVPTLLNTKIATSTLQHGTVVTVDATNGFVYEGELPELLERNDGANASEDGGAWRGNALAFHLLEKVISSISPLNLTDPSSATFAPDNCVTLHDLARFVHEKSYREMFMMGENVGDLRGTAYKLDVFLPIDIYVVDLGGGIHGTPKHRKLKRSQIASVPMSALLTGMLHKKIPRFGPRPMDLSGLLSIMMRHGTTSHETDGTFGNPCYAIISDNYTNFTARVGYHFSVVDTYCGLTQNKNYISLLFHGGAADNVRRSRRARAMADILKEHGFSVELKGDLINARLSKGTRDETVKQLEMLGSLLQFFRQMDAAMANDDAASLFRDAFLRGDYGLEELIRR
ncbi:MAG: PEP/pyruvate-binding domain-containing protein [Desulfuromonadaceae bacterium]